MSGSKSHTSFASVDSNTSTDNMDDNVTAVGDLIAYSMPDASLHDIEKEIQKHSSPDAALRKSHREMNAMKKGSKERAKEESLLKLIQKRARKRGEMYETEAKEAEDHDRTEERMNAREGEVLVLSKDYVRRRQAKDQVYDEEIRLLNYENNVLKAQVRQYRTKIRKMKRLAFAAIDRDDYLHETANENIERGRWPSCTTKSDDEDDEKQNKVKYRNSKACDSELDSEEDE